MVITFEFVFCFNHIFFNVYERYGFINELDSFKTVSNWIYLINKYVATLLFLWFFFHILEKLISK